MHEQVRFLVVDDNPASRKVLTTLLEQAGHVVLRAGSATELIKAIRQQAPAAILLASHSMRENAAEVCAELRRRQETASVPVLLLTETCEPGFERQVFSVGATDYVPIPLRADEVMARVAPYAECFRLRQRSGDLDGRVEELSSELAVTRTKLSEIAWTDPLTDLLNRKAWEEEIDREHARFLRHGRPYSVVTVDVDCFKTFNAARGHQVGDGCLRSIAGAITDSCRRVDIAGRYGGDEFVILAPDTRADAAATLAERIRRAVWALNVPHPAGANTGRVTVSLGIATSKEGPWERILADADDALFVAKRAGRNMVYHQEGAARQVVAESEVSTTDSESDGQREAPFDQISVLVVDDELTNRIVCKGCLERAGYIVRQAVDGQLAIDSIKENAPDVILMDVMMPNMDGLTCTRILKSNPDTRDIPIIIVSALGEGEDIMAGLEAGADEYVVKPIRTSELTLRVRSMARQYHDRKHLLASFQSRGEHMRILGRLVEFCRVVGTSRRLDDVFEQSVSAVADVVHASRISIMVPEGDDQRLRIVGSRGVDEAIVKTVEVVPGAPIAGKVFSSGTPIVINSEAEREHFDVPLDDGFFASVPLLCTPLGAAGRTVGVLNATERIDARPFEPYELEYIELIAKVAATAIHDIHARVARDQASDSIMVALAKLAEHRDNDTGLHLDRVTRYCEMLAEELARMERFRDEIDDVFMNHLARSVPLHDIGKVAIPDHILLHPGKLTDEQFDIMRTHAAIGASTIESLIERTPGVDFLFMAADITHYHHEWFDGTGYPDRLAGESIPLSARITAVADVYDALTTKRVYKDAFSHDKAVAIIVEGSGTQFDPVIVDAFVRREREFGELARAMADDPNRKSATTAAVGAQG